MQIQSSIATANLAVQPPVSAPRPAVESGAQASTERTASSLAKETAKAATKDAEDNTSAVQEATKRLQDFVSTVRADIQFSMDSDSGQVVVKVIDRVSKEVLRQIPSKEALEIASALDRFQGLLVKQEA